MLTSATQRCSTCFFGLSVVILTTAMETPRSIGFRLLGCPMVVLLLICSGVFEWWFLASNSEHVLASRVSTVLELVPRF